MGTSSLPERLRWDAYAEMKASALSLQTIERPKMKATDTSDGGYTPGVSYVRHFEESGTGGTVTLRRAAGAALAAAVCVDGARAAKLSSKPDGRTVQFCA